MPTVLLTEDDADTRFTSVAVLGLSGIEAVTADNGTQGIGLALSSPFDLVLIDLHLPDLSGLDVLRRLKTCGVQCPLVIVTAFPELDSCFDAANLGADGYLEGPLLGDEIVSAVETALRGELPVRRPGNTPDGNNHSLRSLSTCGSVSRAQPEESLHQAHAGQADARVAAVMSAVEKRLSEPLESVAVTVNLSASRLRHLFKMVTGRPLVRFRHTRRLDRSAVLLRDTTLRISEIADAVGLELKSLDRAFRRRFHHSPSEYRRRHQKRLGPGPSRNEAAG